MPQGIDEWPFACRDRTVSRNFGPPPPSPQDQKWVASQKRVAADVLATLDAFEEKRVLGAVRDFEEGGHRRQEIGNELLAHRHECAALGAIPELFKGCELHRSQTPKDVVQRLRA